MRTRIRLQLYYILVLTTLWWLGLLCNKILFIHSSAFLVYVRTAYIDKLREYGIYELVKYYNQIFPALESPLRLICPPHTFRATVIFPSRINLIFSICSLLWFFRLKCWVDILSLYAYYAYKIINKKIMSYRVTAHKAAFNTSCIT